MKKNLYLTFIIPMIFIGIHNCGKQDTKPGDIANCHVDSNRKLVADKSNFKEDIGGKFVVHNWEKELGPVFKKQFEWEGIGPNYVRVFQKQDGYIMFYGTYSPEGVNKNNYPLGIAWSNDGLNWERHPTSLDEDGFKYQTMDRAFFPNNPTGYDYIGIAVYRETDELPFRIDFYKSKNGFDWDKFKKEKKTWWFGPSDVIDFFYDYSRKKFYMYHKIWKVEGTKLDGEKYVAYFPTFRPEFDREKGTVRIKSRKESFTNNEDIDIILRSTGKGHEDGGGGTITENLRMLRVIALAESDDFLSWTNHKVVLEPEFDNYTAQYYSSPVMPSHGLHLCFPRYLQGDTGEMHIYFGISDLSKIELISKQPVIECGTTGSWDSGLILSSTPVEIKNKLCMYYGGRKTSHTTKNRSKIVSALGRAWLRMDGFVSYTGGTLVTKPMSLSGKELQINAKGEIAAHLFAVNDDLMSSGSFKGDEISETIIYVDTFKNEKCYIKFDCSNGELFSFWVK